MFRKLLIVGLSGVLVLVGGGLTAALAGNNITTPGNFGPHRNESQGKVR